MWLVPGHPPCPGAPGRSLPASRTQCALLRNQRDLTISCSKAEHSTGCKHRIHQDFAARIKKKSVTVIPVLFVGEKVFYCLLGIMTFSTRCALLCVQILHGFRQELLQNSIKMFSNLRGLELLTIMIQAQA